MGFSVVQTGATSPSLGQFEHDFSRAPDLAAFDLQILGRDAYGVLVKGVSSEQGDASFLYPTKTAFYREITWLLWKSSTGEATA